MEKKQLKALEIKNLKQNDDELKHIIDRWRAMFPLCGREDRKREEPLKSKVKKFDSDIGKAGYAQSIGERKEQEDYAGFFTLNVQSTQWEEIDNVGQLLANTIFQTADYFKDVVAGSTLCSVLQYKNNLFVGNVGDSSAFIFAYSMQNKSFEVKATHSHHNMKNIDEKNRVIKGGGKIIENGMYVEGIAKEKSMHTTRSLGDKGAHSSIISEPNIYTYSIPENQDEIYFLVLCSDGFFPDMYSLTEFEKLLKNCNIDFTNTNAYPELALTLNNAATKKGSYDNTTVLVASLSNKVVASPQMKVYFVADGHGGQQTAKNMGSALKYSFEKEINAFEKSKEQRLAPACEIDYENEDTEVEEKETDEIDLNRNNYGCNTVKKRKRNNEDPDKNQDDPNKKQMFSKGSSPTSV